MILFISTNYSFKITKLDAKRETICDCLKNNQHYDQVIMDTKFKGTIEKIYNLLYTSGFIPEFLNENNDSMYLKVTFKRAGTRLDFNQFILFRHKYG